MARLVQTETEMEGRYHDVWVLVDEDDDVETWRAEDELALVGRPTPRHDGAARAAGQVRYTVDVRLAGMLHAAVLRSPVAHGRVTRLDLDAARRSPGVRAVLGPETELSFTTRTPAFAAEPAYAGQPIAAVAADTLEQALAALAVLAPEIEPLPHVVDPDEALREQRFTSEPAEESRGDAEAALAAAEVTCRGRARDTGTAADGARAARGRRVVERRRADGVGLDPGHVRRPRRAREELRPAQGPGARDHGVRRRRLRRQAGRRLRGDPRGRAGAAQRQAGAPRQRPSRRAARRRPPLRDPSDGAPRSPARRHHRGDRGGCGRRDGPGRLGVPRARAGAHPLPVRRRAHDDVSREDQPAAAERVSRARGDGGHGRVRAGDRRARRRVRHRPARAPPPQPRRRRPGQRPALLEQGAACLLRPGRGARRLGRPRRPETAPGGRLAARHGLRHPDLVGRWRASVACDDPARRGRSRQGRHRDPGHRHRDAHGGPHRRGRGARAAARPRARRGRRHRAQRLRPRRRRLADDPVRAAGGPLRRRQGARAAAAARGRRLRDRRRRPRGARRQDPLAATAVSTRT